jgi:signal transduction histidine kinase/ActR/RegA family two-component response regulator
MSVFLRDTPIKRKLMLVILLASGLALLLMGSALITYEVITFRRSLAVNMGVLAEIIGSNSTASLAFHDAKSAREILSALSAEHQITSAAIYDNHNEIFAHFPTDASLDGYATTPGADGYRFRLSHLEMFHPIKLDKARIGTIYLQADLAAMYSRIAVYGALLLLVTACAALGAIILTATLQKRISQPILELADVATAVSERQDYSVRGTKRGTDEIGQLTEAFNQMLARIEESNTALITSEEQLRSALEQAEAANKAKDNFLAILSHELRTPLTPVLSTVAMLEEDSRISTHIPQELEMIRRNIEVEARLIDDLLDVTGIARGKLDLRRQVVDIRALLEHAMQNYCAEEATKKKLHISKEITASETHVLADASRMTQVFWNLLQNACKFTPEDGAIYIRVYNEFSSATPAKPSNDGAESSGTELVVEIKDTGIGISLENMPRIFNAFEQGERSRTRVFGGLGLGLAISRAIVEMHRGSIKADSEGTDKGSTMTIRLPTVSAPVTKRRPQPDLPILQPAPTTFRSLRVLLVEDHRDTANQLSRLLTRAGHEVTWASTLREARELIASRENQPNEFNILISDLGLPDGNGQDLMRDIAGNHYIPGIALSGYGMKDDIQNSMAAGFSKHITKPVDWQELKVAIQDIAASKT